MEVVGVHVGGPKCAHVKDASCMSSIYHNMINLVFSIEIRGSPSRFVDIKVLESGTSDNHVLCGSEGYQSEAIVGCFLVQTVFFFLTFGKYSLHEKTSNNGFRLVSFAGYL